MSDVVIRAEGLGKKYLIGHERQQERYTALRDVVGRTVKGFARSARDMLRGRQLVAGDEIEEFWALKNVNFEIKRGEVVGIIGRNGAGKSTLLKILSRITEPSTGRVEIKGRVASLLEVGTGFHPELTGRENIYLNGAILGMTHAEIRRKFDEIVAFAEVEKFLDTPVKRYSSGMYVRLAFAVAAHLEPEILVVDEVLAVGDAEFQKKCLGKMQDVASHGRTVLFVSHNMGAIERLTRQAILLRGGQITEIGSPDSCISHYLSDSRKQTTGWSDVSDVKRKYGNGKALMQSVRIAYDRSQGSRIIIETAVKIISSIHSIRQSFTLFLMDGTPIGSGFSPEIGMNSRPGSTIALRTTIASANLAPGLYIVGLAIGMGNATTGLVDYDVVLDSASFEVNVAETNGTPISNWVPGWGAVVYSDILLDLARSPETRMDKTVNTNAL